MLALLHSIRSKAWSCLLTLVCSASASSHMVAQEILGIDSLTGEVLRIDARDGNATPIGSTGLSQNLWHSLARDSQGKYYSAYGYWHTPYAIYEINPNSGQATFVSQTSLNGLVGLAFGPGDVLYGINTRNTPMAGPVDLHVLDPATGQSTLIGDIGMTNLGSLSYSQGFLWSFDGFEGLARIDPVTGLATDVNPGFLGPRDLNESLCISDAGVIYQVDAGLWVQDDVTGVPAFVGPLNYGGILGGVEWIPGAAEPFTLGTLGETGGPMGAQVWSATPGANVVLLYALGPEGAAAVPPGLPCAGTPLDLNPSFAAAAVLRADAQDRAALGPVRVPASYAFATRLQALDLAACGTSNRLQLIY